MENEVKRPAAGSGAAGHRRLNAAKLTGQKPALKMKEVWSIRTRLELDRDVRNLVLFNLAIDSKLRGCDLVRLKVGDVAAGGQPRSVRTGYWSGQPVGNLASNSSAMTGTFGRRIIFVPANPFRTSCAFC